MDIKRHAAPTRSLLERFDVDEHVFFTNFCLHQHSENFQHFLPNMNQAMILQQSFGPISELMSHLRFSYPYPLRTYMIKQLPNNEPVDILCHHSVANKNMKSGKIKLMR